MEYKTEQEKFWAGQFGDDYIARNQDERLLISKTALFSKILAKTGLIQSVLEFGSNIGLNLKAVNALLPSTELSAIEINNTAAQSLQAWGKCEDIFEQSILDFVPQKTYEMTMVLHVLIHINPDELTHVYKKLYDASHRWIFLAESYNPTPVEVNYRGNTSKYFKRDFAGELMAQHPDLKLVDYGFVYHNDPSYPLDDPTWFLLEKPTA
ncbi:pseudaminic acid biosynthesis-associated methylase [Thiomicrorhabdus sp.]|uniref:pseudaminic acid biosynthesis-associated methylase n=1 Tax=Thiomicrorhabdus sp. TaxID=2039724 RepID=UPI002AA84971|nr:pseudaminic acid biosynthesis-associated methylase [Thiomicrorhabdus sp.]